MVMRDFGRRLRGGLVFGCWAATLFVLIISGKSRLFLRPEFDLLLGGGVVIALGFFVAILRNPAPLPLSRTLILLVPLVHIAASEPASMGASVFSNRFLGVQAEPSKASEFAPAPQSEFASTRDDTVPDDVINQGFQGVTEQDVEPRPAEPSLTILQLLRSAQEHVGKPVRLLGLLHRDASLAKHFGPGREVALYRFLVTCCAADAMPVTVALDGEVPELTPDQWVDVEGTFELSTVGNRTVPLVRADRIILTPPPTNPFLY